MAKKTEPEVETFRFKVLSDNYAPAKQGAVVNLPSDSSTAALVAGGHLEPLSKAAEEATET